VTTRALHLALPEDTAGMTDLKYRVPFQPALDGNTVEVGVEQAKFAENAIHYQAALNFINSRISSLNLAITGS
jgi:flagellar basal-body rod protein FlgB